MTDTHQGAPTTGTTRVKRGMAEMLKGGVIMDVVTPEQARIAEGAGAVAVMALERVPADIRAQGGVSRMSDPDMIEGIIDAVTIPVMAKARIGHFVEAQILQALGVDYIDESEVLTPADYSNHIDKFAFDVPFVCGATNLGEALRRIAEGAAMIRSKVDLPDPERPSSPTISPAWSPPHSTARSPTANLVGSDAVSRTTTARNAKRRSSSCRCCTSTLPHSNPETWEWQARRTHPPN